MKIDENIMEYCRDHSTPDEDILNRLTDYTFKDYTIIMSPKVRFSPIFKV